MDKPVVLVRSQVLFLGTGQEARTGYQAQPPAATPARLPTHWGSDKEQRAENQGALDSDSGSSLSQIWGLALLFPAFKWEEIP